MLNEVNFNWFLQRSIEILYPLVSQSTPIRRLEIFLRVRIRHISTPGLEGIRQEFTTTPWAIMHNAFRNSLVWWMPHLRSRPNWCLREVNAGLTDANMNSVEMPLAKRVDCLLFLYVFQAIRQEFDDIHFSVRQIFDAAKIFVTSGFDAISTSNWRRTLTRGVQGFDWPLHSLKAYKVA